MSYRRHSAIENVLEEPGERDITAHVCFTALEEHGRRCGLAPVRFEDPRADVAPNGPGR